MGIFNSHTHETLHWSKEFFQRPILTLLVNLDTDNTFVVFLGFLAGRDLQQRCYFRRARGRVYIAHRLLPGFWKDVIKDSD